MVLKSNVVTGSTLVMTQESLQNTLPFPDSENYLYDEWIACVLALLPNYSIIPCDDLTMEYRIHEGQLGQVWAANGFIPHDERVHANRGCDQEQA